MVEIKTPSEIAAMRETGRIVARALSATRKAAAPGTKLTDLDDVAAAVIAEAGARPAFLGYQPAFAPTPFPAVICASVNDVIVHGIPTGYRLRAGDVVSIDCGAYLDGWAGDAAVTFTVGPPAPADRALISATEQALAAGIAAARPGNRIGDIGHAIAVVAARHGYGVPGDFGGHGIGRHMHEDPSVPNRARAGRGLLLREGMALAIEPMFIAGGGDDYRVAADGWSLRSVDGSRAAHAEHSVAIADPPLVLTAL
ncbi:type I methionyl aminopeptidase [Nonomuraea typhae]|uniref:Methionine aminopeptidase n=1 Tax=Nonomuraea typhae TaxID=2603600 RepID=A0ABW7Z469_9ACTN